MDRYYVDYQGQAPFTGKERDRETGFSYFGARYYDSDLTGLFLSVDPMSDKYPNISPYAYCVWNPVKIIDPSGDSCAVLLARGAVNGMGHMAILVQNKDHYWQLWSKNGDDNGNYKTLSGEIRGTADDQPGKDLKTGEIKTFKTIQEFLDSEYNTEKHDGVGDYYYTEAYVIPTTQRQDKTIEEGMQAKMDERYNFLYNNCSQAVVYSLRSAGVRLMSPQVGEPMSSFSQPRMSVGRGTMPIATFELIRQINPGNRTYYSPKNRIN